MATNGKQTDVLTVRQRRAIDAILIASDYRQAAEMAKVGYRSLMRWLDDERFKLALRHAEDERFAAVSRQLTALRAQAIDTLQSVETSARKDSDRRLAAAALLDYDLRFKNLVDIQTRIGDLERRVYEQRK